MTDQPDDTEPNEILAAARHHKAARKRGKAPATTSWPLAKIGLAAGIGSAAIAGAVLFASRGRDKA